MSWRCHILQEEDFGGLRLAAWVGSIGICGHDMVVLGGFWCFFCYGTHRGAPMVFWVGSSVVVVWGRGEVRS